MQNDQQKERVESRREVFRGPLIAVEHWTVRLQNGKEALREVVRHNGAAAIVALDDRQRVTLVAQYRTPMGRTMLEIPAGKKDTPEEDGLFCAQRELAEETGLRAARWAHLSTLDVSPGYLTERIDLYLATELSQGETSPDEDEFLHITQLPLREAVERVMRGEITDAKTMTGLLMAWTQIEEKGERGRL